MHKSLFAVVLVGLIGFLYPMYQLLIKIEDWSIFITPPGIGEVTFAVICGLTAVAAALGVDLKQIIRGLGSLNKVSDLRVSDSKLRELNK